MKRWSSIIKRQQMLVKRQTNDYVSRGVARPVDAVVQWDRISRESLICKFYQAADPSCPSQRRGFIIREIAGSASGDFIGLLHRAFLSWEQVERTDAAKQCFREIEKQYQQRLRKQPRGLRSFEAAVTRHSSRETSIRAGQTSRAEASRLPLRADAEALCRAARYKNDLLAELIKARNPKARIPNSWTESERSPKLLEGFLRIPDILGIGFGAKMVNGRPAGSQPALRIYVRTKKPRHQVRPAEIVPSVVNGIPTDVIPVGKISLAAPIKCGTSVGPSSGIAGTLGCLVEKQDAPLVRFILSCSHVLADSPTPRRGDPIFAPALLDVTPGNPAPQPIAQLEDWGDLAQPNELDAAIAQLINPDEVSPELEEIGQIVNPPLAAQLIQSVRKHGRTTAQTVGVIMDLTANIKYLHHGKQAVFLDQLGINSVWPDTFGLQGDSGALIVDAVHRNPVGLLVAVGAGMTSAHRIGPVLARFNARIVV